VNISGDRLVERLHRLLVVLEDDCAGRGVEMPPLAVYDVRAGRWLLAAGVPLETLREDPCQADDDADFVILAGSTVVPVLSNDPAVLMTEFVHFARSTMSVSSGPSAAAR
jgi:hypothetical protein